MTCKICGKSGEQLCADCWEMDRKIAEYLENETKRDEVIHRLRNMGYKVTKVVQS